MLDHLLYSSVLIAPELGAAANAAFQKWARELAKDMAQSAIDEAVKQTKAVLPGIMQTGANKLAQELAPSVVAIASASAEGMITNKLMGFSIVPTALHEAQLAVVHAVRQGKNVQEALAALDALNQKPA